MKTRLQDLLDKETLKKLTETKTRVKEAYADGTISPDEDAKMDKLKKKMEKEVSIFNNKSARMYAEADKIGGKFRGPGYRKQLDDILFGKKGISRR